MRAELARPKLAAGEHDRGVGVVDEFERGEHAGRHDRQPQPAAPERTRDGQCGAARVEDQRLVGADQSRHDVGDVALLLRGVRHAGGERRFAVLALQGDRPAHHAAEHAECLERVDVAADGHLGHVELGGEFGVGDLALGPHALLDAVSA